MTPRLGKSGVRYLRQEKGKYWIYSHPKYIEMAGKPYQFPVGTKRAEAIKFAQEANIHYDGHLNIITGRHRLLPEVIKRYRDEYLLSKNLAKGTLSNVNNRLRRIEADCKK